MTCCHRAELVVDAGHAPAIEALHGDEHSRLPDRRAGPDRLGAKPGKERREDRPCLECAEGGDNQFGNSREEHEDAIPGGDRQMLE
jgi:hypothetical protein